MEVPNTLAFDAPELIMTLKSLINFNSEKNIMEVHFYIVIDYRMRHWKGFTINDANDDTLQQKNVLLNRNIFLKIEIQKYLYKITFMF
jgi:hypothetical protein